MLSGFHHVTLNVTDLPRARAIYEGVLGFEVDQDFPGARIAEPDIPDRAIIGEEKTGQRWPFPSRYPGARGYRRCR
ncbi:VOC family protein [Trebonia sp.]|uniref:VOC family protein n=1 Tax=Trebonia sp. TaxID=2767075 RepID=UPI00345C5C59